MTLPDFEDVSVDVGAFVDILNFFVPFEVVSGVGLIFAMENIVEAWLETGQVPVIWIYVYIVFALGIGVVRYYTADESELDELEDDLDTITE